MKRTTLFVLSILMSAVFAVPCARAQSTLHLNFNDPTKEKDAEHDFNRGLNAGKVCLDYQVDVPTLVDNDHSIYWKQADCIVIHITNNPFRYSFKATVNEDKVAEDDVIGSLGSLFGLKSITSNKAAPQNPSAQPKNPLPTDLFSEIEGVGSKKEFAINPAPKACTAEAENAWLGAANAKLNKLKAQLDLIKPSVTLLQSSAHTSGVALDQKDSDYARFLTAYLETRRTLLDASSATEGQLNVVRNLAYKLQGDSLQTSIELTGDKPFEASLVAAFASAKAANQQLASLDEQAPPETCTPTAAMQKERDDVTQKFKDLSAQIQLEVTEVQQAGVDIANQTCHYKERKQGEYSWVHDKVYESVSAVLANPEAFGADVKREGPFTDPTSTVLTIARDSTPDDTTTSITDSDGSALDCSADPSTVFNSTKPVTALADIPAPTAKPSGDTNDASNSGNSKKPKNNAPSTKPQDPTTTVLQQPWIFGRARLILSGGITTSFLADKQYQRATDSSGAAVVGLKTDSRERLTPMLYGHVLLGYGRHDPDAWYGTIGVTAKSDNQSTDPEFLVGLSRSFAQQRFFFTLGSYIGEKQKLDGGLQLGQPIPSSLTGELPVSKGYHVGWGFGISYRFASTKDPQKDTTAPGTSGKKKSSK